MIRCDFATVIVAVAAEDFRRVLAAVAGRGSLRTLATGDRFRARCGRRSPRREALSESGAAPAPHPAQGSARHRCPSHEAKHVPQLRSRKSMQLWASGHGAGRRPACRRRALEKLWGKLSQTYSYNVMTCANVSTEVRMHTYMA